MENFIDGLNDASNALRVTEEIRGQLKQAKTSLTISENRVNRLKSDLADAEAKFARANTELENW